ncbi:unnamed protein product [Cuscuta epithymum]|uniref:Wax synthase domain-containing protein n=1 Tax=Cuscuta epithymum TaxID=186058 RepID=A0AAV0D6R5_9ASTE|nr:unnamed protein product [Cuscuta epithymum]CAH9141818.1 unnamed protein product [Cuscuta epithymum]
MEKGRDVKSVIKYWMEGEITNFIMIWTSAYISLCYCYFAAKLVQKGMQRLFFLLPVVCLLFLLPLNLHSIHLGGTTGFFLAWLANFKLLLLAFGHGPLSDPSISLPRFLALACFPVNVQKQTTVHSSQKSHFQENPKSFEKSCLCPQNRTSQESPHQKSLEEYDLSLQNGSFQETPWKKSFERSDLYPQNRTSQESPQKNSFEKSNPFSLNGDFQETIHFKSMEKLEPYSKHGNFTENPYPESTENVHFQEESRAERSKSRPKFLIYAIKGLLLSFMIGVYNYSEHKHHKTMTLTVYFIHIYIYLEIILAILAAMTSGFLGLDLEPQFKDPYFTTSLQNFWGGRWNLMVNRILRPTVYNPVLRFSANLFGREWAAFPAVLSTFAVSGLMHELMFFYLGRVKPTWEITLFFVLHGSCLAVEIAVKKKLKGRYRLPRFVATSLSLGFLMATGFWLFFPQLLRCQADTKAFAEYANVSSFLKEFGRALTSAFE